MGFFSKILDKLGMGGHAASSATETSAVAPQAPASGPPSAGPRAVPEPSTTAPQGAPTPPFSGRQPVESAAPGAAMGTVDVVAQLEQRAAAAPQKLNWRTSIVDLLKLLDMDSSLDARKDLATELGCPPELMGDSAKMNVWLHKEVLARIAANGGNVPRDLLD